ncbi:MAG: patatin-like phospholipase family protein [bacterium]
MEQVNLDDCKRIAFVASGGATKALFYHIGVSIALKEYGIEIASVPKDERDPSRHYVDHVVGSSGGAIFGALAVSGFDEGMIETKLESKSLLSYFYNTTKRKKGDLVGFSYQDVFCPNLPSPGELIKLAKRYASLHRLRQKYGPSIGLEALVRELLPHAAFFNLSRLEKYLEDVLTINDFEELHEKKEVDFHVIATEVDYPRKAVFGRHRSPWIGTDEDDFYRDRYLDNCSIARAVRASCSLPGIFAPTEIDGAYYYDGEVKKVLSTHVAKDHGADLILVSHTFTPYIRNGNMGSIAEMGIFSLVVQAIYTILYQKIQTPREIHAQIKNLYRYIDSDEFKKKFKKLSKKEHSELLKDIAEKLNFNPDLKYIFFPSPNETFFMDHFNMLPFATRELINSGYTVANEVLPLHGLKKLPEYEERGILQRSGLKRFRFDRTQYEQYRKVMRANFPNLIMQD